MSAIVTRTNEQTTKYDDEARMDEPRAGRLERIWLKRMKGGPMDPQVRATLVAGQGLLGNANQGGKRQVTILAKETWDRITSGLPEAPDASVRRANLLVSGVDRYALAAGCCAWAGTASASTARRVRASRWRPPWPGCRRACRAVERRRVRSEPEDGDITVGDRVSIEE